MCNRTQISPPYSQGSRISGFEAEPRNRPLNVVISGGRGRRPLDHTWRAPAPSSLVSIGVHTNLLLWTPACSSLGVKMGHLINGNHFHPSTLREGIIVVLVFFLFSFPPGWGWRWEISNTSLYIFLQAQEHRPPLEMVRAVMRHSLPKASVFPLPPRLEGDSARDFGSVWEI